MYDIATESETEQITMDDLSARFARVAREDEDGHGLVYVSKLASDSEKCIASSLRSTSPEKRNVRLLPVSDCAPISNNEVRELLQPEGFGKSVSQEHEMLRYHQHKKRPKDSRSMTTRRDIIRKDAKPEHLANEDLVGKVIYLTSSDSGELLALVTGYRAPNKFLLFFFDDGTHEVKNRRADWQVLPDSMLPFDTRSLVGCRIYITLSSIDRFLGFNMDALAKSKTKVPYEAYVVKLNGNGEYTIFITDSALNVNVNLKEREHWQVLGQDVTRIEEGIVAGFGDRLRHINRKKWITSK